MRYKHIDNIEIVNASNKLLSHIYNDEELVLDFNNEMISIFSFEKITGIKTQLVSNITSDQSYAWLKGFNIGMTLMDGTTFKS